MGTDDEDANATAAEKQSSPEAQGQAPQEEDRGSRVDAAKAFFRAMYAGDEPPASAAGFAQQSEPTATQTACRNCEGLEQSLRDAEQKTGEAEKQYTRLAADWDNYRKRVDRERDEAMSLGVKKVAESVVPALDDLDRAMSFLKPDTPTDKLIDSFKLVGGRMLQALELVGLKAIECMGQPFDPRFHEPVQQIETTEHPDGVVMQELRRGYMLGDKVIRPALVNVASNSLGAVEPAAASEAVLEQTVLSQGDTGEPNIDKKQAEEPPGQVYDLDNLPDE